MKKATLQLMLIALVALTLISLLSLRPKNEDRTCSISCSAPDKSEAPMLWDLLTSRFSAAVFLQ